MNLISKLHLSCAFFMIVPFNIHAQNITKVDQSSLVTQMLGIENISPAEANSYFVK
jgi:hypothetical protein